MSASSPPKKKPAKTYKFATMKAEAKKNSVEVAPFVIDDVTPPIVITGPDSERSMILMELTDGTDQVHIRDLRRALEALCGDAYPRVWELVRREDQSVMLALFRALADHFREDIADKAEEAAAAADAPGGSPPS